MAATLQPKINSDWGSGFVAEFTLQADSAGTNGWTIAFDGGFEITNLWNASIVSHVGTHYVLQAMPYNGALGANQATVLGFQASGSSASFGGLQLNGASVGTGTILPPLGVNDASAAEPASGTADASFTVWLGSASSAPVTVAYSTVDGTAKAGADYTATSGTLTFAPGETSKTVAVKLLADTLVEGPETLSLQLSSPNGGTLQKASATLTVADGTTPGSFSVANASVAEPATGTTTAQFTVTLSKAATVAETVAYATQDGTAKAGTDYVATSGTLTFAPGETSKTVAVTVNADAFVEGSETFRLALSNPSLGGFGTQVATGTILDTTPTATLPTLAVADASVTEPSTGTAEASFTVTLGSPATTAVTVQYATADGTAKAGTDYTATTGTLTFAPGETSKTVAVTVQPDSATAANTQFQLLLTSPSGATLADAAAVGTILNSVGPATTSSGALKSTIASEWQDGFVDQLSFTNTGSAFNGWTVSFDAAFSVVGVWNAHLLSHTGTHYVFQANDYNASVDDGEVVDFGFQATGGGSAGLSNLTFTAGNGSFATAGPATEAAIKVNDILVTEPSSGEAKHSFTVTLDHASTATVTVDYATKDGTAKAYGVYEPTHGTLTFAPGETSKTVEVTFAAELNSPASQTFTLELGNAHGATLADSSGRATVLDSTDTSTGSTGTLGYLHTDGNQIVDASGTAVQLNSVSWFGFEGGTMCANGLWARSYESMMDQMVQLGFNSIRLPYCDQMFEAGSQATGINYQLNPDLVGLSPLQIMDRIVDYAGKIGLKIVLDHHRNEQGAGTSSNGLWYDSQYSEAKMTANWTMLADRYGSGTAVIGADLHNEPFAGTWGDGSATDWQAAAQRIGDAVLTHAPNWLIFVEGTSTYNGSSYWWGGNLEGVATHPVVLSVANRLVYSPHDYPNSIFPQTWFSDPSYPNNEPAIFAKEWGYIYQQDIAPIWLGEWGSKLTDPKDVLWASAITNYLHGGTGSLTIKSGELGPSWSWWAWNPNSGDTGGILKDDWTTVNLDKLELLQPLMYGLIKEAATSGAAANQLGLSTQDVTGNGHADVLFQHTDGTLWFWDLNGSAIKSQGAVAYLGGDWTVKGSGDVDGSGHAAVMVEYTNGVVGLIKLDSTGTPTFLGYPGTVDPGWSVLTMRDMNGDGTADVLLQHDSDHSVWLWHLQNAAIKDWGMVSAAPATGSVFAGAADFNGDGLGDLLWKGTDGALSVSFTDGTSATTTKALGTLDAGQYIAGIADFNGDGKADLLVRNADGAINVWAVSGNIVTAKTYVATPGNEWHVATVGDFDGDGKADVLFRNDSGGLYLWHMDGATIASQGGIGSVGADWHVVAA